MPRAINIDGIELLSSTIGLGINMCMFLYVGCSVLRIYAIRVCCARYCFVCLMLKRER